MLNLRSLLAILTIAALVTQTASKLVILLNFQLNQEYIAKNLCVKKEEKDNCCQGSCHLKKELQEDDKKNDNATTPGKIKIEKDEYCSLLSQSDFADPEKEKPVTFSNEKTLSGIKSKIYRPPCHSVFSI